MNKRIKAIRNSGSDVYWTGKGWEPDKLKGKVYGEDDVMKMLQKIKDLPTIQPILYVGPVITITIEDV